MRQGFKAKTIKLILSRKIGDWLATIDDEELRRECADNTIVTGGCIASMLLGEDVNDYDVYFTSFNTTKKVATYYMKKFAENRKGRGGIEIPMHVDVGPDVRGHTRVKLVVQSAGIETVEGGSDYRHFETRPDHDAGLYVDEAFDPENVSTEQVEGMAGEETQERPMYSPVFLSSNAISLKGGIQLVLRFYGEPGEIHANYDFTHCTNFFRYKDRELGLNPKALECLLSRELVYQGSLYPICSMFRIRKFVERGWRINAGQMLKIAMQIGNLDLTKVDVLEDQLTGVDVAYFTEVIEKVRNKDPEKVNAAYLTEIINRLF